MTIALYMDEHIHASITVGLRLRDVNVLTVQEDQCSGIADTRLLDRATERQHHFGVLKCRFGDLQHHFRDLKYRFGDLQHRIGDLKYRFGDLKSRIGDLKRRVLGFRDCLRRIFCHPLAECH